MGSELNQLQGEVIGGRFRLGEMIGKGGYGAVFDAEQLSMGRRCAVKVLRPGRAADETVEKRFRAEARTTSRLNHPNTVVVYDFGADEETGFLFLATEFLDGITLHQLVERRGRLGVGAALPILEQVAASLADAHQKGLIHRDVKPRNIMLVEQAGRSDFVKVIDFGIAKALEGDLAAEGDLTRTGMLVGTPQYLAPEHLVGDEVDERADQYALAVVAYRMLTGHNPFRADTPVKTAMRQVNHRPLPLSTYCAELQIGERFEDVLLRALAKTPDERFDGVVDFVDALRAAAPSEQLVAGEPETERVRERSGDGPQPDSPTPEEAPDGRSQPAGDESSGSRPGRSPSSTVPVAQKSSAVDAVRSALPPPWVLGFVAASAGLFFGAVVLLVVFGSSEGQAGDRQGDDQAHERVEVAAGQAGSTVQRRAEAVAEDAKAVEAEVAVGPAVDTVVEARTEGTDAAADAAEQQPGRVTVTLIPWGTLYVDGEPQSDQVRQSVTLDPGRYELTLRQHGEVRATRVVDVDPGESKMVTLEAEFLD